jgi:hypothetical protein
MCPSKHIPDDDGLDVFQCDAIGLEDLTRVLRAVEVEALRDRKRVFVGEGAVLPVPLDIAGTSTRKHKPS